MDRWKAEQGRGREKRKIRRKQSKKKKDADAWKGRKVTKHCVFPMTWGSVGSKSRLAKAAGAEPAGHALVARSTCPSQNVQNTPGAVEKVHAVVARSTFPSQNVQNTPAPDHFRQSKHISKSKCTKTPWLEHFWKLRCRKSARRCGAKPILNKTHQVRTTFRSSNVEKVHAVVGRSTFGSQNVKNTRVRTTFGSSDVEKMHAVVARSTSGSQNVKNTRGSIHFWRFRCCFASLHYITLHYTPLHYTPQHYNYNNTNYNYNYNYN